MKSKYFGYTLRGAGTPYQQWILSELPIVASGVYTSSSTTEVAAAGTIPMQCIVLNQVGGRVNANGSISLPQGLYKVEYSGILSTAAASPVKIDLMSGNTAISEVQAYTATNAAGAFTATITGTAIVKSPGGCIGTTLSVVNNSAVSVTPVAVGLETFQIVITRLC